ncbi:MAG: hypothetical protein AAF298_06910 [Cyanobacteria bacterium P01_A01_bin.40]
MSDNPEQNSQPEEIVPYQSQPRNEIISSNPESSDLENISQSLVKRIENREDIDEIAKIISVLSSVEEIKERRVKQDIIQSKARNIQNEIKFRRKIEISEIIRKNTFGIAGLGAGLLLISKAPLLAPILIIIGLSGVLDFKLKDVSELLSNLNNNQMDISEEDN